MDRRSFFRAFTSAGAAAAVSAAKPAPHTVRVFPDECTCGSPFLVVRPAGPDNPELIKCVNPRCPHFGEHYAFPVVELRPAKVTPAAPVPQAPRFDFEEQERNAEQVINRLFNERWESYKKRKV